MKKLLFILIILCLGSCSVSYTPGSYYRYSEPYRYSYPYYPYYYYAPIYPYRYYQPYHYRPTPTPKPPRPKYYGPRK